MRVRSEKAGVVKRRAGSVECGYIEIKVKDVIPAKAGIK
jgi:hypothetical protein